jgi:hypothetical protein
VYRSVRLCVRAFRPWVMAAAVARLLVFFSAAFSAAAHWFHGRRIRQHSVIAQASLFNAGAATVGSDTDSCPYSPCP